MDSSGDTRTNPAMIPGGRSKDLPLASNPSPGSLSTWSKFSNFSEWNWTQKLKLNTEIYDNTQPIYRYNR
jgi:hypothetical protein